jgi:hypothetical protein
LVEALVPMEPMMVALAVAAVPVDFWIFPIILFLLEHLLCELVPEVRAVPLVKTPAPLAWVVL